MAVRQGAPAAQPAAPVTRLDDPEVERVARMLEEYAERWREAAKAIPSSAVRVSAYTYTYDVRTPFPRVEGDRVVGDGRRLFLWMELTASADGVTLTLVGLPGESVRLVPPDDARKAAALLVHLERNHGLVSKLLAEVRPGALSVMLAELEAVRRYGPLFGRGYEVPEVEPWAGDVYRNLLEAALARLLHDAVVERRAAVEETGIAVGPRRRNPLIGVRVSVGPLPFFEIRGRGRYTATLTTGWGTALPDPAVKITRNAPQWDGWVWLGYGARDGRSRLSVLDAAFLMLLERAGGALTKYAEAAEEKAKALEPFTGEALVAAEAAHLFFGQGGAH